MNIDRYIKEFSLWELNNFWIVYDYYIKKIYDYFYYRLNDKEISEDLTSEIFMKIFMTKNSFNGSTEKEFTNWIYRIAHNKLIDYYRWDKQDIQLDELNSEPWFEEDIAGKIDNSSKIEEILDFLNSINPTQKDILIMRIWDDLSYKEIAQITWKSVDNCKKIVSRLVMQIEANMLLLIFIFLRF